MKSSKVNCPVFIAGSEVNVAMRALEIYVAGCTRKCKGCHNPETHDFMQGIPTNCWIDYNFDKLYNPIVQNIWVLGGDLLCYDPMYIKIFIGDLRSATAKPLWLFTGEENIKDIPDDILAYFDYVKTGSYIEGCKPIVVDGIKLASPNQKLYKKEGDNGFCRR